MDLDSIKDTYFAECVDQLSELETGLFTIQSDGPDSDTVNSVFRAVHSIKGGAGAFALDDLVSFAHVFENALDIIRNDLSESNEDRVDLLLRCSDVLNDIVAAARDSADPIDCSEITAELEKEFNLSAEAEEEVEFDVVPISLDSFDFGEAVESGTKYTVKFTPKAELYLHGHDPVRIFREVAELGACTVTPDFENVPTLDSFDPKQTKLFWTIELTTESPEEIIRSPFEWVEDLCELTVESEEQETEIAAADEGMLSIDDFLGDFAGTGEEGDPDSEIDAPAAELEIEEAAEVETANPFDETAEPETTEETKTKEVVAAAEVTPPTKDPKSNLKEERRSPASQKERQKASKPIRVESDKVDRLINLMGEMVISQSMLTLQINEAGFGAASQAGLALVELQNLTREIQSSVMSIRAQPIKPVFMRMSRVVREVCGATGKKANLVLEGENTEVDTTVIEGLSDPLTHMIRNSVDHGVESVEKRLELGKPEQGQIRLCASHSSGSIVIEIIDDGAGINRERVLQLAIEKGIVQPDAKLSDDEIDNLIFAPGFSTSAEITDVSGRGVGMDVVRSSIQGLGGRVSITSKPGVGSHFTLHLPLTLAILDGMLVRAHEQMLVLPVTSVVETMMLRPEDVHRMGEDNYVFKLRDQLVPIVDVGFELGFGRERKDFSQRTVVIVETGGGTSMCAFVVDSIVGQQQVVIKSMESNYQRIPCIAAATILGNGRIALILDVEEVVHHIGPDVTVQPVLDKTA